MNILFVGYKNPSFWAVTEYIERTLLEMGHRVSYFDYRSYRIPGRLRDRFQSLENWDRGRMNRRLRSMIERVRPELFLLLGGYTIEPGTIAAARRSGAVAAAWFADYPLFFERYAALASHYDVFFTSGTDALARHQEAGNRRGHWLPFACVPDLHRPVPLSEEERARYASNIAMVGTAYPERIALLEHFVDFKPALWGPGWDRLPAEHPLRPFVRGGSLTTEEWLKVVAGTKIALNFVGAGGSSLPPERLTMANSRCFELLGCGAFQLVDAKKDIRQLFQSGGELVCFSDPREAARSIGHYLENSVERLEIGRRAREAAERAHTYRHRLAELLKRCGR